MKTDVYTKYDAARSEIAESWNAMDVFQRSLAAERLFLADAAMLECDEHGMHSNFALDTMRVNRITWDGNIYFIEITDVLTDTPLVCFSVSAETEQWWVIDEVRNATRIVIAAYRLLADYRHATR